MARMSRRTQLILAAVVVLAVLAPVLVNLVWPHYRPPLRDGETYGLDVSSHQGTIDWPAVARDGVSAAYVKASEGGTWKDSHFEANWRGARAAGLRVGAYHFFTLCRDGAEQAENFLAMLRSVEGPAEATLAPVVDLELGGNCADRPAREVVLDRVRDFVERVERETGQRVMFYVLDDFERLYPLPPQFDRPRWERRMLLRPEGEWAWWQVNNRARVDGVEGPVDLNVLPVA